MYKINIKTDLGDELLLDYEHGYLCDVSPLSGINVDVATQQGFNQTGENISGTSIKGISRILSGVALDKSDEMLMLSILLPGIQGELTINGKYTCDFVVKKTPEFKSQNKVRKFICELFCPTPFWREQYYTVYELTKVVPNFSFPVCFDSHIFGEDASGYVNCYNSGSIPIPYILTIYASGDCSNFKLQNVETLDELKLNVSLHAGETLTFNSRNKNNQITLAVTDAQGKRTNIISKLDETSNLLDLRPHDNLIKFEATNKALASVTIHTHVYYSGVVVE